MNLHYPAGEENMTGNAALKSNTEWQQWGREDPLWGVATWANKHKDGSSPWTEEEFYAVGESDFQDFFRQWQHYGVSQERCLEIGCGAGRLTRQLALAFHQVDAVDVSQDMIERARRAVGHNVQFSLVDGLNLPQPDNSATAVFSALVLQHLDSAELGFTYFREFFRVLEPEGTLMIQIPLYRQPYNSSSMRRLMDKAYRCYRLLGSLRANVKRRTGRPVMRVSSYSIESTIDALAAIGFRDIEFRFFQIRSNGELYSFVFARK
jgi:ubiquinone/menaquinone biosynthesis C-methylase UbiE